VPEEPADVVCALRANPILAENIPELRKLQETLPGIVADRHPGLERVVCPFAIRRELIWDTHKQASAGVQHVFTKLQLRWYWPRMRRDIRLKVKQCEICQASKHGRPPGDLGWRRLYAGRPWQVVAVDLVGP